MSQHIPILYQDERFIFVEKPSGLLVHKTKESSDTESLVIQLRKQLGQSVFTIHRLDRSVSGVIGFGLSSESARQLQEMLQNPLTEKRYLALVYGVTEAHFSVDKPLTNDHGKVQSASTDFRTLDSCQYCSFVEARIHTGRRHQIRRHLSHKAHPIIGDRHYGKGRLNNFYRDNYALNRIFLHAHSLLLKDIDGNDLKIISPLPPELQHVIDKLSSEGLFDSQKTKV